MSYTEEETVKRIKDMAVQGQLLEKKHPKTTKEKRDALFNNDKALSHEAAHTIYHAGFALTSIKTWGENNFSSGLNVNNMTALCKSAFALAKHHIPKKDKENGIDHISTSNVEAVCAGIARAVQAYRISLDQPDEEMLTDDDDEEMLTDNDDLFGEPAADETKADASVVADYITYDELKAANATAESRNAMVQGAMGVFFGNDNVKGDGYQFRYDGKTRSKTTAQLTPSEKSKKTTQEMFMNKVASMAGMNMANIATNRGGRNNTKWASDHVFKGGGETANPNREMNMLVRNRIGTLWCAIVVKSGATKLDHDMRRYISDETIQAIQDAFVCPDVDLSDAPTYKLNGEQKEYATGWIHTFKRGNGKGRTSFNDLMDDATTFL
jgi:hypothetical protein